jgi:thymidylate synthase (FAD)
MKLIKSSYEILPQAPGLEGVYKQIELAGRVCYKSEDKITETSAKEFVDMLIKRGHLSVLEHGTVYLAIPATTYAPDAVSKYLDNPYSKVTKSDNYTFKDSYGDEVNAWCVTTNLRVIIENNAIEDLEFICEPTEYHQKRTTVKFICSRSTSHQLVRHRVMSFAQESQRYCNYSLDKFDNEITFVYPSWLDDNKVCTDFEFGLIDAEVRYFNMIKLGYKPQQARQILPNACKTELVVTGFNDDWNKLLDLRCGTGADPDIKQLMNPLKEELWLRELP